MDPVTILCSILAIADASKKVSDGCSYYIAHARKAPKELQTVIEDINALNGTMKRFDSMVKSTTRTGENAGEFDHWELPLRRIEVYTKALVHQITQLDLRVGLRHELRFRAQWSLGWRAIEILLSKIRVEKGDIQLATAIRGNEMIGMVYDIVTENPNPPIPPPRYSPALSLRDLSERHWERLDPENYSQDQIRDLILERLGRWIGWDTAKYDYPSFDDLHQDTVARSGRYTKEMFLECDVYQAWKTRKIPGPGLLFVEGEAVTGKTTLCCRVAQDLQNSAYRDVAVVYNYFQPGAPDWSVYQQLTDMLRFWIIQLALQCQSLPAGFLNEDFSVHQWLNLPPLRQREGAVRDLEIHLTALFKTLLPNFRRTFLLLDGLGGICYMGGRHQGIIHPVRNFLRGVLEQDAGNVSMAIFTRPCGFLDPLLRIADVSIRLTQIEPNLSQYIQYKIGKMIKPELAAADQDDDAELITTIERTILDVSDGLYLAVDVLIDSLLVTIRNDRDISAFLRQARESNEIMLQRDPESMKQKAFGIETPNPLAEASNQSHEDDIMSTMKRCRNTTP